VPVRATRVSWGGSDEMRDGEQGVMEVSGISIAEMGSVLV
jgi:hypothetical protein